MEKYKNNEIQIRDAIKDDMKIISNMIKELAAFEKKIDGPKLSEEILVRDGFETQPPAFRCKIAELTIKADNPIVGYALYFPIYSTWDGKAMLLEDLYVDTNEKRKGIGERLFNAVAKEAVDNGCSRLDFHVLEWNDARDFYEKKGAVNLTKTEQWCYYRLWGDNLSNASKQASN